MSIGLRDIAKGKATSAESRELIVEIIDHHMPETQYDLNQALLSRVFLIVRMGKDREEIKEWYDITMATSAILARDFSEISIRINTLAQMLYRYLCEADVQEQKPLQDGIKDHAQFFIRSWTVDSLKLFDEGLLIQRVSSIVTMVSMALERALPAQYTLDSVQLKIYPEIYVLNGRIDTRVQAEWRKCETLYYPAWKFEKQLKRLQQAICQVTWQVH